ncbi:MAG: hypothetical protein JWO82_2127 [Akkermansiaceae bacterium]|nr:hypothetical protein [Akkermansiaceae bacterium]
MRHELLKFEDYDFSPLDLSWLPEDLTYPDGQVSLVVDPQDRANDQIAVYLVNATGRPLLNAVPSFQVAYREVKTSTGWVRSFEPVEFCGVGPDIWSSLPGGMAALVASAGISSGDLEGEIRYMLPSYQGAHPPLVSAVLRGRYSSADLAQAKKFITDGYSLHFPVPALAPHPDWTLQAEEYVAFLELLRSGNPALDMRAEAQSRIDGKDERGDWPVEFEPELRRVLAKEWPERGDTQALFARCMKALSSAEQGGLRYGDPARSPGAVWSLLDQMNQPRRGYLGREDWLAWNRLRQSGNPWGAEPEVLRGLVNLAKQAKDRSGKAGRSSGNLLLCAWVSPEMLSNQEFESYLDSGSTAIRRIGFLGLANRGRRQEALEWLAGQAPARGAEVLSLWREFHGGTYPLVLPDRFEVPVLVALLRQRQNILPAIEWYYDPAKGESPAPLPKEIREGIIFYLRQELDRPDPQVRASDLMKALEIIDGSGDRSTVWLLKKYLHHPAVEYGSDLENPSKFYPLRSKAKELLQGRLEQIPPDAIFEEPATREEILREISKY